MHHIEGRGQEHEHKLDRFRNTRQKSRKGHRGQHTADFGSVFRLGCMVHSQSHGRHTKHHHGEETGHKHTGSRVAGKETIQVTCSYSSRNRVGIFTKHEPDKAVQNVVQPHGNQQAVQHTVDKRTYSASADNPFTHAVDKGLTGPPYHTEHSSQDNGYRCRHNENKAAAAEKAQIFRQFYRMIAVVQDTGLNTADDTGQHTHIEGFINGL